MKKLLSAFAVMILLFAFSGCAAAAETFDNMQKVLKDGYVSEQCVYSAEISSENSAGEKEVYTGGGSELVLTFEKTEGSLARLTMESVVNYTSTPPYADQTRDYNGLTDSAYSEVVFNAYADDYTPVSVKKRVTLQTAPDKSFEAEFTYPVGKEPGQGKYKKAGGEETAFSIKPGKLKNAFDNEQIYYMVSGFLGKETGSDLKVKLGYDKQFNVFNLADYLSYGYTGDSLTFSAAAEQLDGYNGLNDASGDKIAKVTVSFPGGGRPLVMYYTLGDAVKISGNVLNTPVRKYLLLGYEQETLLGSSVSKTSYTLKEYSRKKA